LCSNLWATGGSRHHYVSASGSDSNSGTVTSPFRQISKAASAATAGTVIHVAPGNYGPVHSAASGTSTDRSIFVSDTKWGAKISAPGQTTAWMRDPLPYAEDVMAARKQWSDLSQRTRRLLITVAVAEGILKVAALIDLRRRPASQVRGPKWLWATVVTVVSSAGVAPVSYFAFGRRQPGSQSD
jgi:hypothetical protein